MIVTNIDNNHTFLFNLFQMIDKIFAHLFLIIDISLSSMECYFSLILYYRIYTIYYSNPTKDKMKANRLHYTSLQGTIQRKICKYFHSFRFILSVTISSCQKTEQEYFLFHFFSTLHHPQYIQFLYKYSH
jgi:hypothetical protein